MFDFHININQDLSPAKVILYAKNMGLKAIALMQTLDYLPIFSEEFNTKFEKLSSNIFVDNILQLQKQIHNLSIYYDIQAFFGVKLSFIPPQLLEQSILFYKNLGIGLIGVQGESISEIVEIGTNFAACNAKANILFSPGLIDEETVKLAALNNVFLEISTHRRHAYCNAHLAKMSLAGQAKMVIGSNASKVNEIHDAQMQKLICKGANIEFNNLNNYEFYNSLL